MGEPKNILVITYWERKDALIQTYTLPYLRIILSILPKGSNIWLVTFENDITITQQFQIEKGIHGISFPQFRFGWKAIRARLKNINFLTQVIRENEIKYIHTWCTPAGALGWRLSVKTGISLILDSYEPHAEAMVENGTWKRNSLAFRLLFYLEKKQTFHAAKIICAASKMPEYAKAKFGFQGNNFYVKPACVDLQTFHPAKCKNKNLLKRLGLENKIVCVYAGKTGGIYLEREVFRLAKIASDFWGDQFRFLFLTGTSSEKIQRLAKEADLTNETIIAHFVPHAEIQDWIGLGDFAITPVKPVPTKKYCSPIKDAEYWALGLPVIITEGISDDSDLIASENAGYVLKNLSDEELNNSILAIDKLLKPENKMQLTERIRAIAETNRNFETARNVYLNIYQNE
ncbi:hypothetical protein BH09BAC5_BH09BAC5_29160 [soil metagenome]